MSKKIVLVKNRAGKEVRLLTPGQKSKKYAIELKQNKRLTNFGEVKKDKSGNDLTLSDTKKSYRAGYLAARKDNAKVYNYYKKKSI